MQPTSGQDTARAVAALLVVQLLFGTHYSAAREITAYLDPIAWTAIRQFGGAVLLVGAALVLRKAWPRRGWGLLGVLGLLGVVLNQLLFNAGIQRSTAVHGALVMATVPAQTLALGVLLGQERLTRRKLVSVALGAVGIAALFGVDQLAVGTGAWLRTRDGQIAARFSDTVLCGDLLIFGNAAAYSVFLALSKRVSETTDPLILSAAIYACSLPMIAVVGVPALLAVDLAAVPGHVWLLGALVIVGPTAVAYILSLYALRRLPTSLVGLFINVQFIIAAATAAMWHGERLDDRTVLAAAAVLLGLSLRFVPERRAPPS
ncbi:DMT family transporter [Nannocystis punicea]|uniref:DMT family transporter n=1 Tax=Nannocystis punicea TaxID=2995304 RepID=A0ABY7GTH5_9BACT|nr:DMT family transporter [Nannocystis poenicansa]WAS90269.1 DMT family transporter [Nannocystis poenicansa]